MKILLIENTEGKTSLALTKYVTETASSLNSKEEIDGITLITAEPKTTVNEVHTVGIRGSPYSIKGNILFMIYTCLYIIKMRRQYDIVHALYPSSSLIPAYLAKLLHGSKLVYELRSPWVEMGLQKKYSNQSKILTRLFAYSMEAYLRLWGDGLIFITDRLKDYYTRTFLPSDIPFRVFPSATNIEVDNSLSVEKLDLETAKLVHLGTLEAGREIRYLLINFKKLLAAYPRAKLDFIGDGDDEQNLIEITNKLDIKTSVNFLGRIPSEEVPIYLKKYDIGITHLPPKDIFKFSSPIKNYEYLSLGLYLLLSKVEPNLEFEKEGFASIYDYNSPNSFIRAFEKLNSLSIDPDNIRNFLSEHTYDANADKILELYREIL